MNSSTTMPTRAQTDTTWLRLVHVSVAVGVVSLVVLAYVAMFFDTISRVDSSKVRA